jgi:hypothetical protein
VVGGDGVTWQIPVGFRPQHWEMLLDIEEALWESSDHLRRCSQINYTPYTDDEVAEAYKEIQQVHQHIKDAIAILKESVEVTA